MDKAVFKWFQLARSKGVPLFGPMLQEAAKQAATELHIQGFKASNGLLEAFRNRHNIRSKQLEAN